MDRVVIEFNGKKLSFDYLMQLGKGLHRNNHSYDRYIFNPIDAETKEVFPNSFSIYFNQDIGAAEQYFFESTGPSSSRADSERQIKDIIGRTLSHR